MKIKIIRNGTIVPTKAYSGDAGFDVYSTETFQLYPNRAEQVKLGFAIEIAENEVCIMSERSGMAISSGITSIGNVIDSGYRGEVSIILLNTSDDIINIDEGDKIGQMLILSLGNQNMEIVEELSDSQRGEKAHNSSGK